MKAIVTGGCGFIGSHAVDLLLSDGYEVVVLDNLSTGRLQNLAHQRNNPRLTVFEVDLAEKTQVDKLLEEGQLNDAEYIYHYAALADIVPSIVSPQEYYKSNVTGTFNILEIARKLTLKKFIYAASSSCYGIPDTYPTSESAVIQPEYPYALTKYLGETLALHWSKVYHLPVISMRFFNVYGPRSRTSGTYGAVFGVFLAQKIKKHPFTIVGDGTQTRDFTFVTDVVKACVTAGRSAVEGEIFNVGSGNHYSVNYLAELLGGDKIHIPKRPGEPDCTFADIAKIKKVLHWSPEVSFEDGVRIMVDNIDYWKEAPLWTPDKIHDATRDWFKYLGK